MGSLERFMGSLIEFYAGKFPLWISPSQIAIIAVAERHIEYGTELQKLFTEKGFEVFLDDSSESVSKKIRGAQLSQYNYILTIGDKEVENKTVNVRTRDNEVHGEMAIEPFVALLTDEIRGKKLTSALSSQKQAQAS